MRTISKSIIRRFAHEGEQMRTISESTLVKRINRRLAHEGEQLRRSRGYSAEENLGEYYKMDLNRNSIIEYDADPETIASDLGLFRPGEIVERRR